MITRTGWSVLVGSIGLLVVAAFLGYDALAAAGAAGLLALAIGTVWVRLGRGVGAERAVEPERVEVGGVAFGELTLVNTTNQRVPALQGSDLVGGEPLLIDLPSLARGGRHRVRYRLPTQQRGLYDIGPLSIVRADPMGLVRSSREQGAVRSLWVHPRRHALVPLPAALTRSFDGPTSDTAPRGTVTFHAIREYEFGDELRHVHWPATAHTGELMVREFIDTSQPDLTVVLDVSPTALDPERFEAAVEIVASLLVAASTQRFPLRYLSTTGDHLESGGTTDVATDLLDRLAAVTQRADASLATADRVLADQRRGHAGVIVAGNADSGQALALQSLARRFNRTTVVSVGTGPAPALPAVQTLVAHDGAHFAELWNAGGGW